MSRSARPKSVHIQVRRGGQVAGIPSGGKGRAKRLNVSAPGVAPNQGGGGRGGKG